MTLRVPAAVADAYHERFDREHAGLGWSHPGMTSWYKNAAGRMTTTSPWRLVDYWRWTREPDLADFALRWPKGAERVPFAGTKKAAGARAARGLPQSESRV